MPVATMLSQMSSSEISTWEAFFKLEAQDMEMAKQSAKGAGGSQDFPGPEAMMGQGRPESN